MAVAALLAFGVDFASKTIAVAAEPSTLLFNVSQRSPFGLGESLILVVVACSLVACILPTRVVALAAGVALGGAFGNLASLHVWSELGGSPDFIRFGDGSTGNVADIFLFVGGLSTVVGALLWVGRTYVGSRRRGDGGLRAA